MKYQIQYSPIAVRDLDRVFNEVLDASKDYDVVQKYMDDLLDAVEDKAEYPQSGAPLYYEDLFTGYYYIIFKAYLVFYGIEDHKMLVDRVLFAASDYMRYLFQGNDS